MNNNRHDEPLPAVINLADVYFVIFRHKWKIVILAVIGLVVAGYFYHTQQPPFQSDAELLIRYVQDARSVSPTASSAQTTSMMDADNIMRSEVALIISSDLAATVTTNVGPEKILAKMGGGNNSDVATAIVHENLKAEPNGNMIHITFSSQDPTIVQPILRAVVDAYRDRSDEIHGAVDMTYEQLMVNTGNLKNQLDGIEEKIRRAKKDAGVIDVEAARKSYSEEIARLNSEISEANISLAEHEAALTNAMSITKPVISTNQVVGPAAPPEQLSKYQSTLKLLDALQKKEDGYLQSGFADGNKLVKEVQDQIAVTTKTKSELETNYPALTRMDFSTTDTAGGSTTAAPSVSAFSTLPIRIDLLKNRLKEVQVAADKLDASEAGIAELERQQKNLAGSYDTMANNLQAATIRNSLGSGKNANIQEITSPTSFYKDKKKFYRTVALLAIGGLIAGLAWAFAIEYVFDRSIKRPVDIQNKLKIPFFLSIPDLNHKRRGRFIGAGNRKQLAYKNGTSENGVTVPAQKDGSLEVMAWEINRRFDSYYDALRDRLVVYFESINLTRKPKLVAVTSTHKGAGVSTIAAGLASSLSETGDGRVLLVDMNQEYGAAQQYFRGHANCKLDDALESEKRDGAMVQENLYVVTEDTVTDKLPRALPKRFASLIPKLKASDYDYIIFDMPPVSPTSVTSRLASFMDTVMLVIESEKTDQQVVRQANALLAQSKANVTAVLNKTRHYIPARLHKDFLSDV